MQLLRASEVRIGDEDRVFYYSRWRATLLALLVMGGAVACVLFGQRQPPGVSRYLSYYVAAVLLLGLLFLSRYITARFRATNWLARTGPVGLYIKFRSYLNYPLSDADEIIVFIPYSELRSARLLREHMRSRDAQGHIAARTVRLVELDLAVDVTPLAKAVNTERLRPAPGEKHWYGTTSTLFNDYPVRVAPPSFVQVQWSVTPGWKAFLAALEPFAQIAAPISLSEDFTNLSALSREEQEQHLRALDARGETVMAIYTARRLYGYDLTEAKSFITKLRIAEA